MSQQIQLEPYQRARSANEKGRSFSIRTALPFVQSFRGKLAHRPRRAALHNIWNAPHFSTQYLCGGTVTHKPTGFLFTDDPTLPVCSRCEALAIEAGMPSASEIAGRHVCIGRTVVVACHDQGGQQ